MNALVGNPAADSTAASNAPSAAVEAEDIRDIRGPKVVPSSWLLPALLGGFLLLAVAALIIWRRRRRTQRTTTLTLTEQTLQRLDAIRPLMLPGSARQFGIEASEIVRVYIEKRFAVVATQRTTEEFLQNLLQTGQESLASHRPLLAEFLQLCDFVKFAGVSLTWQDMESLFQSARTFVLETGQPRSV